MKAVLASRELLLLAAIAALLGLIATRFPAFIAPSNLVVVFNDTSPLILLAIGQMIVIRHPDSSENALLKFRERLGDRVVPHLRLDLLDLHHIVDPTVDEGARLFVSGAIVAQPI